MTDHRIFLTNHDPRLVTIIFGELFPEKLELPVDYTKIERRILNLIANGIIPEPKIDSTGESKSNSTGWY